MKIGLNTYSFRKELESGRLKLGDIIKIAKNIGLIKGFEFLDRHISGWPDGDLDKGIKDFQQMASSEGFEIYALGPHIHLYRVKNERTKEIEDCKRWIDLAADNGIPNIRVQIGGPWSFWHKMGHYGKIMESCTEILDECLPYARERNVKIGVETHHRASSWPPFLKELMDRYNTNDLGKNLGIIFDWGNFRKNKERYQALEIAALPENHCHNHVKIFHFGENFQEKNYDSYKIVRTFAQHNFKDYFSIEWEGTLPTLEGVYKSAHALQYAINEGNHKINYNMDYDKLLE